MADEITVRVRITGRVQGVWFRGWTKAEADRLGLHGWVRNLSDGSVSALISGPRPATEAMLALLHIGPEMARVLRVETRETADPGGEDFRIV